MAGILAALLVFAAAPGARAEVLDELAVFPEGTDAVVRIAFGVRIQYLRSTMVGGDSAEIVFQIISADLPPSRVEEGRRLKATAKFPGVRVTYPAKQSPGARRLLVQFSRPIKFRIRPGGNSIIDLVIAGAGQDVVKRPTPGERVAPGVEKAQFAVRLESFPQGSARLSKPVPSQFQDYAVFTSRATREGKVHDEVLLGYFATAAAAQEARRKLLKSFPAAEVVSVAPETAEIPKAAPPPATAAPAVPAAPGAAPEQVAQPATVPPAPPPATPEEVEARAAELMAGARRALDAGNAELATEFFNRLLILPPNRQSREAQELAGVAREKSGETAKARAEYDLYLKLYPDGKDADRVRKRLAGLGAAPPPGEAEEPRRAERPPLKIVTGTISQYYYGGNTKIESSFNTPTAPGSTTFSAVDQSSLVNNVDVTGRYRTGASDTRLVFRDSYTWSLLKDRESFNRLNAAYYDYRGLQNPLSARLGRQTGLTGGLPSRFDGGMVGYGVGARWRINAVGGLPVEYPSIDARRHFFGANVEFEGIAEAWNGNLYFINQQVDGILDRRAVGAEVRYFNESRSLFSLVDYDTSYNVLNTILLQGTWTTPGRTTINVLYDRRRAPTLTTTNAIFGQPTTSIETLLLTLTEEQIRAQALNVTAIATQALLGVTTPINAKWQLGGDARLTNVGALPATVVNGIILPAQPATGDLYSFTGQAIGTGLYSERDTSIFGVTYLTGPTYDGWLFTINNRTLFGERWSVEPSLQYYTQSDTLGFELERWTPGVRVSYRVGERVSLEGEFNWENSTTVGPASKDEATRSFYYLGYRWDM